MVAYVGLEIGLHGLARSGDNYDQTLDQIRERVKKALVTEFNPEFEGDIDVVIVESAGKPGSPVFDKLTQGG